MGHGTAGHGHVMDDCLKGSNALFYSQAFCLDTQVSCRPEKREAVSACKRFWASPWGSVPPLCPLLARAPLLWDKALCVLQEGAHGWLVDDEAAFSGAAKLRRLRGRGELGSLARRPRALETAWHRCLLAGPGVAASGGNHAFISFAVGHGSPVVIGSCRLVRFLLPAFLGGLTVLPVAPGAAGHSC